MNGRACSSAFIVDARSSSVPSTLTNASARRRSGETSTSGIVTSPPMRGSCTSSSSRLLIPSRRRSLTRSVLRDMVVGPRLRLAFHAEELDDVALFEAVEAFDLHAALEVGGDVAHVFLEALEARELALVQHLVVAHDARRVVAVDR